VATLDGWALFATYTKKSWHATAARWWSPAFDTLARRADARAVVGALGDIGIRNAFDVAFRPIPREPIEFEFKFTFFKMWINIFS
jgi:hypothetical protein